MFGRATITLGIGPHSSSLCSFANRISQSLYFPKFMERARLGKAHLGMWKVILFQVQSRSTLFVDAF